MGAECRMQHRSDTYVGARERLVFVLVLGLDLEVQLGTYG